MSNRASKLDARVDKVAAGFTIIETILFIAIAGLVFTGVIVGTNGAIRRQRYKDAVQTFTDDLRSLYALAESTEVLDYDKAAQIQCAFDGNTPTATSSKQGRGRSNCSVYGIIAKINMQYTEHPKEENLEAYWLIGKDEKTVAEEGTYSNDIEFLNAAYAGPKVSYSGGSKQTIEALKTSLVWGTELGFVCDNKPIDDGLCSSSGHKYITSSTKQKIYLVIYRSPFNGSIRTLVNQNDGGQPTSGHITDYTSAYYNGNSRINFSHFSQKEVDLCVIAGNGMSYSGGLRMISIKKGASFENDVRLVESDSEENICND